MGGFSWAEFPRGSALVPSGRGTRAEVWGAVTEVSCGSRGQQVVAG
jgi:hypothetical protein